MQTNLETHKTNKQSKQKKKTTQNKTKQNKQTNIQNKETKQSKTNQNKNQNKTTNKTKQNKTKQNKTTQHKTKQNKTKPTKETHKQNKTKEKKGKQIIKQQIHSMFSYLCIYLPIKDSQLPGGLPRTVLDKIQPWQSKKKWWHNQITLWLVVEPPIWKILYSQIQIGNLPQFSGWK